MMKKILQLLTVYLVVFAITISAFYVPYVQNYHYHRYSEERSARISGTTTTQLLSQKKGYGPAIPAFRFSDNIIGAQKPRDTMNWNQNNMNDNNNNNNVNGYINGNANDNMRTTNTATPPEQYQQPMPSNIPPPPPPPPLQYAPEPIMNENNNNNNNMNVKRTPALSYLEQLQQQQQPPPPAATTTPMVEPPVPVQQPQQPVVYNDFSEYERQLRQFTRGN